jgi:surfeit locus 1 family protein
MSSTPAAADAGWVFHPRLWPTAATAAGLAVLLALGTWQLQRLGWKRDLIARAQAQLAEPAVLLPPPGGDLSGLDFRRVAAAGTYDHDAAFAFGLFAEDGRPGGRLVTPLRLAADGRVILVDRGWLPEELLPPGVPADLEPHGEVAVEGVARWRGDTARGWLAPADSPAGRRWFTWDVPAIEVALGLAVEPLQLVLERAGDPGDLPKARPVAVDLPNDHLGYALTWYGLAAVLVVVYVLFSTTSKPGVAQP